MIPVIIWLYHLDLWDEFLPLLKQDSVYPIIGLYRHNDNSQFLKSIESNFKKYQIQYFDNHGADIAPFLQQIQAVPEPFFIKIHTKRDTVWRTSLVNDLFHNIQANIDIMRQEKIIHPWNKVGDNDIGMIANKGCIVSHHEHTNSNHIKSLCDILNMNYDAVKGARYVSGTMFMSRTNIFKKYFNDNTIKQILELIERGEVKDQSIGTYTHALERIFGYIITNEKMRIKAIGK